MSVIKHDFGSVQRQIPRRLRKLLSLDVLHEANIQANPLPYLERASERLFQLEQTLFEAAQASRPAPGKPASTDTVEVNKADYEGLLQCRAIIEKAIAQFGSGEDLLEPDVDRD
jgi:hypothetical protein